MHFTIDRRRFIKMLEGVRRKLPNQKGKQREVRIYSCAARVFVEANGVTAGEEALVLEEGSCFQAMEPFLALVKSYKDKSNITIKADDKTLRLFSSVLNAIGYTRNATPPAYFVLGKVTDTWVSTCEKSAQNSTGRLGTGEA